MKVRKKPIELEARQFVPETAMGILKWLTDESGEAKVHITPEGKYDALLIWTLEGEMRAEIGDWIIQGVAGEFYPCKPEIFDATYDIIPES